MNRFIAVLLGFMVFTSPIIARAETVTVWGIPLGVTGAQMRSTLGQPLKQTKNGSEEVWGYNLDGFLYTVLFNNGRSRTVLFSDPASGLGAGSVATRPDPLGLMVGDTLDALLRNTGSGSFDSNGGLQIDWATIHFRRNSLNYDFNVSNGRIRDESVTLIGKL